MAVKRLSEVQKFKFDPENEKHLLGAYAAGTAAIGVGGEVGGRHVGRKRYAEGKDVRDGFFQGPSVNRGYFKAKRQKEGSSLGDGGSQVKKAMRDQNSSPGASITMRAPHPSHKATTMHARSGAFAGQSRGVGRKAKFVGTDTPKATSVRTPTLREINGKFAGEGLGVKVFHPPGGRKHSGRANALEHWTGGYGKKTPSLVSVGKADLRKGLTPPMDTLTVSNGMGARTGRRLVEDVEKIAPTTLLRAATTKGGPRKMLANSASVNGPRLAAARAAAKSKTIDLTGKKVSR